jgi:lipopolysaccharide biosynthesis glycosyltransferase
MIIAMACTKNWYHYLMVDLYSLLECTKNVKKVYLLVETDKVKDIPYLSKIKKAYDVEIKLIDFNKEIDKLIPKDNVNRDTIYSNFCFARLALPSLVKEDKILYIDTDAIVRKDISKVWRVDLKDYYVAGCKDYGVLKQNIYETLNITGKYINSGFVLFNLKKIREDNIQEKWFEEIKNRELLFPDQDALNLVCQHNELYLPSMYNFSLHVTKQVMSMDLVKVFHYAGEKIQWVVDKFYAEEWYDAEEKFYDKFGM